MDHKKYIIEKSEIFKEIIIFTPSVFFDIRGEIYSTYLEDVFKKYIPQSINFTHDKFALTNYNVLRGLHGDEKTWKLVSCVYGKVFQVIVDARPNSKTYMKWQSFIIDNDNKKMILVPPGFANGFYVMSDTALYHYKLAYHGDYNDADNQFTIKWNKPDLSIKWPSDKPILSMRDNSG